jgi:hypothetical protein
VTVAFTATREGAGFRVRVRPGAPTTRCRGTIGGALRVDVAAPPERGKANEALVRFLARALGVPTGAIRIGSGAASREKSIRVLGKTCAELGAVLASLGIDDP